MHEMHVSISTQHAKTRIVKKNLHGDRQDNTDTKTDRQRRTERKSDTRQPLTRTAVILLGAVCRFERKV